MMDLRTRLGINSFWLLLSRVGTQGLMVLFTILLARGLGSAGFGEYALIATTIFIGNMLTTFGTDMLLMREIAAHGDLSRWPAALLIQIVLSALFILIVLLGASFFPNLSPSAVLALKIYSLALFPLAFFTVFTSALRGKEHMNSYAVISLASVLLQVIAVLIIPMGHSIVTLAVLLLISQTLLTLLAGIFCTIQIPWFWKAWHFSIKTIPAIVHDSAPIALLAMLGMVYQKLGIYMLSAFTGASVTGWYAASLRAVEASKAVHFAVFTALYPAMARAQTDKTDSTETIRFSWFFLLAGASIAALTLSLFASPLITLFFGSEFTPSIPALRILSWILIPYTVTNFLTLAFVASKKERFVAVALSGSLMTLIVLTILWIPRHGLVGAAWAAFVSESFQAGLLLSLRKNSINHWLRLEFSKQGETHESTKLP